MANKSSRTPILKSKNVVKNGRGAGQKMQILNNSDEVSKKVQNPKQNRKKVSFIVDYFERIQKGESEDGLGREERI